jgi:hypothetical protein
MVPWEVLQIESSLVSVQTWLLLESSQSVQMMIPQVFSAAYDTAE